MLTTVTDIILNSLFAEYNREARFCRSSRKTRVEAEHPDHLRWRHAGDSHPDGGVRGPPGSVQEGPVHQIQTVGGERGLPPH